MTPSDPSPATARLPLSGGTVIPQLGFGVFQVPPGAPTRQSVAWALQGGYRHVDTAAMYQNEADVGEAIRASGIPREEIFVTTKMWYTEHGFDSAQAAARASLRRLGLPSVDLYLIHWPRAPSPALRLDSWRALLALRGAGLCRAVGVANYTVRHLEEIRAAGLPMPEVDQIELHPFVFDPGLADYARRHRIVLEAWAPLTRGRRLDEPVVRTIAARHGRTPAQILLRWGIEHGFVVLPKSVHRERIEENARIFDFSLPAPDMAALDRLADGGRVGAWNPAEIP
ncbi:MAG: aldo/keto reductase [Thermoplasmata archaeon]